MSTYVIAEAGVNHNGDVGTALQLVEAAAAAGADAVKFQTFRADELVTRAAPKAAYQLATTDRAESQYEMIRRLELGPDDFRRIANASGAAGIEFLSTPMDLEGLRLLVEDLGVRRVKIGSGDLTNAPLVLAAARTGLPLIVSSGMATMDDIGDALDVIAVASRPGRPPILAERRGVWRTARSELAERVTVLHCTTEYPAPPAEVNLRAMGTIGEHFGVPVGYSDHTAGVAVAVAAVARGALAVEKHFTMSRDLPGPDHAASLEPGELAAMVAAIREVEVALGSDRKEPAPSELRNSRVARRSLVAGEPITAGQPFSDDNLAARRPGTGLSPMRYWDVLGRRASRDYEAGEMIAGSDVGTAG